MFNTWTVNYTTFNALHTVCFIHGLSIYTMFNALHTVCFIHGLSIIQRSMLCIRYVLYMDCKFMKLKKKDMSPCSVFHNFIWKFSAFDQ